MMSESLRESSRRESVSFECNRNSRKYFEGMFGMTISSIIYFFFSTMDSSLMCGKIALMLWILEIHFYIVSDLGLIVLLR